MNVQNKQTKILKSNKISIANYAVSYRQLPFQTDADKRNFFCLFFCCFNFIGISSSLFYFPFTIAAGPINWHWQANIFVLRKIQLIMADFYSSFQIYHSYLVMVKQQRIHALSTSMQITRIYNNNKQMRQDEWIFF